MYSRKEHDSTYGHDGKEGKGRRITGERVVETRGGRARRQVCNSEFVEPQITKWRGAAWRGNDVRCDTSDKCKRAGGNSNRWPLCNRADSTRAVRAMKRR